ncbi:MAG: cytidylyltransferase domain-containing protein [Pikeienuella sp.]
MLTGPGGEALRVLAVVPARGGSKGVKRKNLAEIRGRSLVARCGEVVGALPWLDAAILSTDDEEIAAEGRRAGLEVPFLRPAELATDTATGVAVWAHAWVEAERLHGSRYDISVLLQPTSPFRKPEDVTRTAEALLAGDFLAATTVSRVPGHYTPQKTLLMAEDATLSFYAADGAQHSNRQSARACWTRNGLAYAARRETVVERGRIVEDRCAGVVIEGLVPNIDDPEDLLIARLLAEHGGYDTERPER